MKAAVEAEVQTLWSISRELRAAQGEPDVARLCELAAEAEAIRQHSASEVVTARAAELSVQLKSQFKGAKCGC